MLFGIIKKKAEKSIKLYLGKKNKDSIFILTTIMFIFTTGTKRKRA
jgi:hypothetical protein